MVRYSVALTVLLTSSAVSGFVPPAQPAARIGTNTLLRRNASTSTLFDDDNNNSNKNLQTDMANMGSAAFESLSRVVSDEQEDDYEAEMAQKERRALERRRTFTVTLNLTTDTGLSFRQVEAGRVFSPVEFKVDTNSFQNTMPNVAELQPQVDASFQGVIVSGVVQGGRAWNAGVRPGDVLRATSATMGNKLWPKSTLEGTKAAVSSRRVTSGTMEFEFERNAQEIGEQYELTLTKPLGLQIQATEEGFVQVTGFTDATQKLARFAIQEGDYIVAVDSALGDRMWPVSTVEGIISACTSRLPGQPIRMRFARPWSSTREKDAEDNATTQPQQLKGTQLAATAAATMVADSERTRPTDQAGRAMTNEALLKRCRVALRRYGAEQQQTERVKFSDKYAVPALVADKILDAVASASGSLDSLTLSMTMNAYLSCRQPLGAIRAFEAAVGLKADGSSGSSMETVVGKEGGVLVANPQAFNIVTASSLMRAHASNGDFDSVRRVLAALEGRSGALVGGMEVAEWPGTGTLGSNAPDTQCYNIALSAAAKSGRSDGLETALSLFDGMRHPKQAGSKPARDLVSYNTIIGALAKERRLDEAFSLLDELKRAGIRPDKFTYTSLINSCVSNDDIQELLYDMKEQRIQPDAITYNTMIKSLCGSSQLFEAKKLVTEMESRGISPDSMTYGLLMTGLLKARKPSACLTLFETACSNLRTAPLTENVHLYTTAITAASAVQDHERAFDLLSRMNAAGVKPNLKTTTALMGACLSSDKSDLAIDVYNRIEEPDSYVMSMAVQAMCAHGDLSAASKLVSEQRSGTVVMSGKHVTKSYGVLMRASLEQGNFSLAKATLTELLKSGYIPSKALLQTIIDSLGLRAKAGQELDATAKEKFDFLLFVLDSHRERNLQCDGSFYSSILYFGSRLGGLERKICTLLSQARARALEYVAPAEERIKKQVSWQELAESYDDYKHHLGHEVKLPLLQVRTSSDQVRQVLSAEQRLSYNPARRRRKTALKLAYFDKTPS